MNEIKEVKPTFAIEPIATITSVGTVTSNFKQLKNQANSIKDYYSRIIFTEENMKEAKEEKATINKLVDKVKRYRIDTVKDFKKPIEEFEEDAKATEKLLNETSSFIQDQTNAYESSLKKEKQDQLSEYFNEYAESLKIDFINLEQANINVTLTASLKSLKEQAKTFIDDIDQGIKLINSQQRNNDRMLVRFKQTLNAPQSIITVINEIKAEEEAKSAREEAEKVNQAILKSQPIKEEPKPLEAPKEVMTITFKVVGTKEQLIDLREFMKVRGIKYE